VNETGRGVAAADGTAALAPVAASPLRWWVLVLVVVATLINYVDRQIIAILKPELEKVYGWTDVEYGHVVSAFQLSAALAYLGAGWAVDKLGLRRGYAIAVAVWSAAAMAHALARNVADFVIARIVLGAAEAANTPAAVKSLSVWFGDAQRSLALGFMNAGANLGAIASPLLIPLLAAAFGWRATFVITGAIGFAWLIGWLFVRHPPAERSVFVAATGAPVARADDSSWGRLLTQRRTWAFAGAKLITDAVWWFMLFWLPDLLNKVYGLGMQASGLPIALVYTMASMGALAGGWLPGRLMRGGASLQRARMTTLLLCALVVLPVPFALSMSSYWSAALLVGLALAGHQGFSTNVFSLTGDLFPRAFVASVVGIGALFGNLGGFLMLETTGRVLQATNSYLPLFLYCASAYVVAWLWIRSLVPSFRDA